jgi:sensor histidine kinase YesM
VLISTILIGVVLSLYFDHGHSLKTWRGMFQNSIKSILLGGTLWYGNYKIANYFELKKKWNVPSIWTIINHVSIALLFSITVMLIFYMYIWFFKMGKTSLNNFFDHFKFSFFVFLTITAIITLFFYSRGYFLAWKELLIKQEKLKRESIQLQYEALKNQVNPHFLFNSLNILTSLIEKDTKASVNYVKQLSEVFRYVLDQNDHDLVQLEDELIFIESFIYLNKIRFGENLDITIDLKDKNIWLVPVSLQILIENALKHNEVSKEKPLQIEITDDEDFLIIKNNLQPRNYLPESNHMGLKNLKFQYEFLTSKKMEIIENPESFTVKLPKIKDLA